MIVETSIKEKINIKSRIRKSCNSKIFIQNKFNKKYRTYLHQLIIKSLPQTIPYRGTRHSTPQIQIFKDFFYAIKKHNVFI